MLSPVQEFLERVESRSKRKKPHVRSDLRTDMCLRKCNPRDVKMSPRLIFFTSDLTDLSDSWMDANAASLSPLTLVTLILATL